MKIIFFTNNSHLKVALIAVFILNTLLVKAQNPQFAVVTPGGTTYICPTWDSAYNKAVDGDAIYLPGGVFSNSFVIGKKLNLIGAGFYSDSTTITNKTLLTQPFTILNSASGGIVEGIDFQSHVYFGGNIENQNVTNFTIKRCNILSLDLNSDPLGSNDKLSHNNFFTENIISSIYGKGSYNNFFKKNVIANDLWDIESSSFENNDFMFGGGNPNFLLNNITNSSFKNNTFLTSWGDNTQNESTNIYIHNLARYSFPGNDKANFGNVTFISDIFGVGYHLSSSSPGKNLGTDGTDVGIYGTAEPTSEGWVPSNPHIYFKQVDANTTSDGKLHVKFKVRTNN